jgi:uncharacterized protein YkwD
MRRLITALAAVALLAIAGTAPAQAHAAGCARASASTFEASNVAIRNATMCLLNAQRRLHGLRPLRQTPSLRRVSARHSRDMVRHHFFAHGDFFGRIESSGYLRGAHAYTVGENIAWGGGPTSSPAQIVRMWMNSPPHRANLLSKTWREIGISAVHFDSAPGDYEDGPVTIVTADFGLRR